MKRKMCLNGCGKGTIDGSGVCSYCRRGTKGRPNRGPRELNIEEMRSREMLDGITRSDRDGWFYSDGNN